MKKLSIIVSVYNEEEVLHKFLDSFHKIKVLLSWEYELLFVNDYSSDSSLSILKKYSELDNKIKVVSFSRNFGHEAAMIAGIDHATGDGIVCMDADLQHPLECLPDIIEAFEEDNDVINMVRISNKSAGVIKNITSKVFYEVINKLSDQTKFESSASDFFAISKRVADVLRNNYREKNRFLRGYVQSVGFKKTSIKYEAVPRMGGESHYSIRKLISLSISAVVSFSSKPLCLGVYSGIFSAIIGFCMLLYTLFTRKGAPSGYATIIILICFLFAMLFIVVGAIGQYLSVLFNEIKDRPIYIVENTYNIRKKLNDKETNDKI